MMQMMIFGMVSLGMIIIPMGFQFLAVLGGKALLIAKFALILSSIQGLRKVTLLYFDQKILKRRKSVERTEGKTDSLFLFAECL